MLHSLFDRWEHRTIPLLVIGLRAGLGLWMALVWWAVEDSIQLNASWAQDAFGSLPRHTMWVGRAFLDVWPRWDAVHYLHIAKFGYKGVGLADMNFFPLYPFLTGLTSWFTFGDITLAGLVISTLATILALILLFELVIQIFHDENLARWTVIVLAIFPTSLFLLAPYTDSLFLCLAIGSLLMVRRRRWWAGSLLACLAGIARAQGVLLAVPLGISLAQDIMRKRAVNRTRFTMPTGLTTSTQEEQDASQVRIWPSIVQMAGCLALALSGYAGYMAWRNLRGARSVIDSFAMFSGVYFNDPFTTLTLAVRQALVTGEVGVYVDLISIVGFGCVLVWMFFQKKFRRQVDLMAYSVATFGLFLVKHTRTASVFQSAPRYVLSLFPVFIGIACLVLYLPPVGRRIYALLSLSGLLVASALYTIFIFVG